MTFGNDLAIPGDNRTKRAARSGSHMSAGNFHGPAHQVLFLRHSTPPILCYIGARCAGPKIHGSGYSRSV